MRDLKEVMIAVCVFFMLGAQPPAAMAEMGRVSAPQEAPAV